MKGGQVDPHPSEKTTLKNSSLLRVNNKVLLYSIFTRLDHKAYNYSTRHFLTDLGQTMFDVFPFDVTYAA